MEKNRLVVDGVENMGKGDVGDSFPEESRYNEAWIGPGGTVGITEGVNDASARLVHDFTPTRYELALLAKHYLDEALDIDCFFEMTHQTGSSEWRLRNFAYRRLDNIERMLDNDEFASAVSEVKKKWDKRSEEWRSELETCPNDHRETPHYMCESREEDTQRNPKD